jgi:pyrophosphatase PpaX
MHSRKMPRSYNGFLFDADGTLIDTTELICRCFEHTLSVFNGPVKCREEIIQYIGLPLFTQFEKYFGPLEKERAQEIGRVHMEYQISIADNWLKPFPGAAETLNTLVSQGKKLAVVTSRRMNTLSLYLEKTGLLKYFHVLITPESTERHKPHPEPALKALKMLNCRAEESLFIGDSSYDIECGAAAKTDTAFVLWSHSSHESLKTRPTMLIKDFQELTDIIIDTHAV